MKVQKFTGPSSRAVLRDVRNALGADAVILSSRDVANGVEILAVAQDDMVAIIAPRDHAPAVRPWQPQTLAGPADGGVAAARSAGARPAQAAPAAAPVAPPAPPRVPPAVDPIASEIQSIKTMLERELTGLAKQAETSAGTVLATELKSMRGLFEQQLAVLAQAAAAQKALAAQARLSEAAAVQAKAAEQTSLVDEVKSMRALLQRELAQLAWADTTRRSPVRTDLHRRLLGTGFGAQLARTIVAEAPEDLSAQAGEAWLQGALERRLVCAPEEEIVRRGGVYALVGPTGVGKTTTAAKLAARCAVRFGARRVALITIDSYRVAAHDQLRAYGKILGVPVQTAHDAESLKAMVEALHERHLVLIDTVGTGQRDPRITEMLAALDAAGARRLLLLNAASQAETLEDVVQAWGGNAIAGSILTKTDEAVKLGPALDCLVRHGLALHYVANGQRVPEDLHVPNTRYLVHRGLRGATAAPLALHGAEYSLVSSTPMADHAAP